MANSKAARDMLDDLNWNQKKKFLHEAHCHIWDDLHLFKLEQIIFCECVSLKKKPMVSCGIATIHLMEGTTVMRGYLQRYFNLDFTGHPFSKVHMFMVSHVINAKELEVFPRGMSCHCKPFWRWRCLTTRALILLVPFLPHSPLNTF